jgi:uncharacterized membrane protein
MVEIFNSFGTEILFLHIISAVIWVGGMIAVKFAVHPAMQLIATESVRISRSVDITKKFFAMVIPAILLLVITGIILIYGFGHKGEMLVHIKEGLWTVMLINFIVMFLKVSKADRLMRSKDDQLEEAKKEVKIVTSYMLPVNIILGIIAIYVGSSLHI